MGGRSRSWRQGVGGVRAAGVAAVIVLGAALLTAVATASSGRALPRADHPVDGCFRYSVRTDHSSYGPGVPVGIVVTVKNISTHDCLGRSCGGITDWFEVSDLSGKDVYRTNPVGIACVRNPPPPPVVAPGHTLVWSTLTWDRSAVPAGLYRIVWHRPSELSIHSDWFALRTR